MTTTARVDLSVTENTPTDLYYKLTPVNLDINAPFKRNPIIDTDVINYSSLKISDSGYNGSFKLQELEVPRSHLFYHHNQKKMDIQKKKQQL